MSPHRAAMWYFFHLTYASRGVIPYMTTAFGTGSHLRGPLLAGRPSMQAHIPGWTTDRNR